MTRRERLTYYILFICVAAPIEIVLSLGFGLASWDSRTLWKPITHALLYLYAFVLTSETRFRIAQHGHRISNAASRLFLNVTTYGVWGIFAIHYMMALYTRVEHNEDVSGTWMMQVLVITIALTASIYSYQLMENDSSRDAEAKAG